MRCRCTSPARGPRLVGKPISSPTSQRERNDVLVLRWRLQHPLEANNSPTACCLTIRRLGGYQGGKKILGRRARRAPTGPPPRSWWPVGAGRGQPRSLWRRARRGRFTGQRSVVDRKLALLAAL